MILTIRTDKPEAEIGLFEESGEKVAYKTWQAHKLLESTLLKSLDDMLSEHDKSNSKPKYSALIKAIVVYSGPGSFTGLRIGFSVANSIAYVLKAPNVSSNGEDWIKTGIKDLEDKKRPSILTPEYGGEINITMPKK